MGSFLFPLTETEDDWMSIFGHVGALLDGLCLIIQCLVSAGWGDGHNPPPKTLSTLIFNKAVHAVTTGHRSIINTNKNCCQTLLLLPIMLFDTTTVIKPLHHNNYTDTANIMTSITSIPALVIHRELLLIVFYG